MDAVPSSVMTESDFEDVMAALRDGQHFQIGGGRIFPTYAMKNGQVTVIISDDGHTEERPCDEQELRRAIAEAPHCFRSVIEWLTAQRRERPATHGQWPPTPSPPTSIEAAETTLRELAPGPPPFGDNDPWDFIHRWPDGVVAAVVWPAVSRLLEGDDAEAREQAIWFARTWKVERRRSFDRLIEVATQRADLYRDAAQLETLALGLSALSYDFPAEQPRVAALILTLFGDALPCRGGVGVLAEHEPIELIERAPKWTDGYLEQIAVREAVSAMAVYHPEHLLELLGAVRSRSTEHRQEILAELEPRLGMSAGLPTQGECRDALGLG